MSSRKHGSARNDPLEQAFTRLEKVLPRPLARALHWLHDPGSRWVRIPLGALFIVASFFWFLPVIGIELLPIGLLLIAQDVPFLRRPVGRIMVRLLDGFERMTRWWHSRRRARRAARHHP
jgi:hypothetical protein